MRRLSWAVLGSTFTMVAAVSLGHAQSAGSMRPPAWAKFCENVTVASKDTDGFEEKKAVRVCMTFHERISGKDGTAIVGFTQALAGPPVEPGARARPDGPILCDGAERRGCSMKPIRQGKR